MVNIQQKKDGPDLYAMFVAGQLVYTDPVHKAWLDEYYKQLMQAPDLVVFREKYPAYLRAYFPYQMSLSYGAEQDTI